MPQKRNTIGTKLNQRRQMTKQGLSSGPMAMLLWAINMQTQGVQKADKAALMRLSVVSIVQHRASRCAWGAAANSVQEINVTPSSFDKHTNHHVLPLLPHVSSVQDVG